MPYVLILLFEYQRYKRDAVVRVYADDRLVDELSLSSDINLKCTKAVGMPDRLYAPMNNTRVLFSPEKMFLFEIDEKHLCDHIRIEVQNDNNNHTNGFMTKFSYVKLHHILLVPNCLLQNDNWRKLIERFPEDETEPYFPRPPLTCDVILRAGPVPVAQYLQHILGGSFSMEIPLHRKHGICHLGRPESGRISYNAFLAHVLCAFNLLNTPI
jgi:hypothetical protein